MQLSRIELPPLSVCGPEPQLPAAVYESRVARARAAAKAAGLDALIVYADREHYANISYFTGFDPRFEEALLLIASDGEPAILAGNEDLSFCETAAIGVRGILCQSLSLPGQDRSIRRRIGEALAEARLQTGARVGVVGWKAIPAEDAPGAEMALAVPHFVVSALEDYLESPLVDATALVASTDGLRAVNEADQLALQEHRSTRASHAVWRAIEALAPGRTELEISLTMQLVGLPLSCHIMCTSAGTSLNGLRSPTDRVIAEGDWFSTAVGYWGGLCSRAGAVRHAEDRLIEAFVDRFAGPYYCAIQTWYRAVAIGVRGGQVSQAVAHALESTAVRTMLDAGHLIHLDEWLDTPFGPGRADELRSGMAIQADIIPMSSKWPDDRANVEDGIALADADLRAELAVRHPEAWKRIQGRRAIMQERLGFELAEEILPCSDRQGIFAPALLSPDVALVP